MKNQTEGFFNSNRVGIPEPKEETIPEPTQEEAPKEEEKPEEVIERWS